LSGCATTGTGGPKAAGGLVAKADKQAAAIKGTRVVSPGAVPSYPEDPLARRLPAKVMRIWIAPWEDSRGDLHAPGYLYTEIEPRRWTVGASPEQESVSLIRPLQIERREAQPSSTRSGRDTGAMRKSGKTKAPESSPNLLGS
jgi:conjugal transfer pilus assembly protein TraV